MFILSPGLPSPRYNNSSDAQSFARQNKKNILNSFSISITAGSNNRHLNASFRHDVSQNPGMLIWLFDGKSEFPTGAFGNDKKCR
jgi:hypothetical protein